MNYFGLFTLPVICSFFTSIFSYIHINQELMITLGEESEGDWVLSVSYDPSVFSTTNRPAQPASAERDSLKSAGQEEKETNYKGALYFVQLVLYGTAERHVNPSKSNPKLAEVGHETSFGKCFYRRVSIKLVQFLENNFISVLGVLKFIKLCCMFF